MGPTATIEYDYIEIDTPTWLQERTAGELGDLNQLFTDFDAALTNATGYFSSAPSRLDRLRLFITARAGKHWSGEEFAIIEADTGTGIVSLSDNVLTYRYTDPEHGSVAFVTEINGSIVGKSCAYTDDTREPSNWSAVEAQIGCPNHHGWTYRNGDLIDETGTFRDPGDVFPAGQIITHDDDGTAQIICPLCRAHCQAGRNPL